MKKYMYVCVLLLCGLLLQAEIKVRSAGGGGWCSATAAESCFDEVIDYKPDTVVLNFGMHDAVNPARLKTPEQFEKNYRALVGQLKKRGVRNIVVVTINPVLESYLRSAMPDHPVKTALNKRIVLFNDVIRKIAAEEKLAVVDLYKIVMTRGGAAESASSLIANRKNGLGSDGLNLSGAGYKLLADETAKAVKSAARIVCYGDNVTAGVNIRGAGTVTGNTYPAQLWRLLNPVDARAGRLPGTMRASSFAEDGNLLRNPEFATVRENGDVAAWTFWKKNKDSAIRHKENGKFFLRLHGAPRSEAFFRSDYVEHKQNRYQFKCRVRGSGTVEIGYARCARGYATTESITLEKRHLTESWSEVSVGFEAALPCRYIHIFFKTRGQVDISSCSLLPAAAEKPKAAAVLESRIMKIAFADPAEGGGAVSLKNASGVEFINLSPTAELWHITLRKIAFDASKLSSHAVLTVDPEQDDGRKGNDSASRQDIEISPCSAAQAGAQAKLRKIADDHLVMEWNNIPVGKEKNALDVRIDIRLLADGSCSFQGEVNNRSSSHTVYYFACPRLDGLGGVRGKFADDRLATPFFNGRLIADPVRNGLLNSRKMFNPNRSGHSLHVDIFSNDRDSLYLAVPDSQQYLKRWLIQSSLENGLLWSVVNVPDNMRQIPQHWKMPYHVQVMPFSGDWFDGCRIYRQWALKQFWCEKGRLADRKDIPVWFMELADWFQGYPPDTHTTNSSYVKDFGRFGLGAWIFYWGKDRHSGDRMMSLERFPVNADDRDMLDFYRKNNVRVCGYIQCTSWSDASDAYKRNPDAVQNLVRNYYGQIVCWPVTVRNPAGSHNIAYPGKLWTKELGDKVVKMAETGFDCAYLDSGNHGGTYMNFNKVCNPGESGGGTGYLKGNMKLLQTVRQRARKVNPGFCITAESFWEGNIASLDAFLATNTTAQYLEGTRVTAIPMAHAVYHDYTILKCAWSGKGDVEHDNAMGFVAKYAQLFCWGGKSGFSLMNQFYTFPNKETVMETSRHRFLAYLKGKKFLVYGEMLRPPATQTEVPLLPVKWDRAYGPRYWNIQLPQILSSMWKAPDGSRGLVIYNIGENEYSTGFVLPRADYGALKKFRVLYPEKLKYTATVGNDKTLIKINCPARVPVVIESKER